MVTKIDALYASVLPETFWKYEAIVCKYFTWCTALGLSMSEPKVLSQFLPSLPPSTAATLCSALVHPLIQILYPPTPMLKEHQYICKGLSKLAPKTIKSLCPLAPLINFVLKVPAKRRSLFHWAIGCQFYLFVRGGHILKCLVSDLNAHSGIIKLQAFKFKTSAHATPFFSGAAAQWLAQLQTCVLSPLPPAQVVFPWSQSIYRSNVNRILGTTQLHSIRRLAASIFIAIRGPAGFVPLQMALQHAKMDQTRAYVHQLSSGDVSLLQSSITLFA